jgi:hypothetical protein
MGIINTIPLLGCENVLLVILFQLNIPKGMIVS